jgi:plasmid stabilization system protein ParE
LFVLCVGGPSRRCNWIFLLNGRIVYRFGRIMFQLDRNRMEIGRIIHQNDRNRTEIGRIIHQNKRIWTENDRIIHQNGKNMVNE